MKRFFKYIVFSLAAPLGLQAQQAIVPAGGNGSGTGGSVSFTVGQIDFQRANGLGYVGDEGVQQTYLYVTFVHGRSQAVSVCESSGEFSINSFLAVSSARSGQVVHWALTAAPLHGIAAAGYSAAFSGSSLTPTGLYYEPTTGYYGNDSFQVRVTVANDTAYTVIHVVVNPMPNAGTVAGADSVCAGAHITLSDVGGQTGGTWHSSNTAGATVGGGVVTGEAAGWANIYYMVVNVCGIDTAGKPVYVLPAPNAGVITGTDSMCTEMTGTLAETITGGTWSLTNGNVTLVGSTLTAVAPGKDTVKYVVANGCGTATASKVVIVLAPPTSVSLSGPDSLCQGTLGSWSVSGTGGTWAVTNAVLAGSAGSYTATTSGIDTIRYSVSNYCGSVAASKSITILPAPIPVTITGADTVCAGSSTTLTASAVGGEWSATNLNAAVAGGVVTGVVSGIDSVYYSLSQTCGTTVSKLAITVLPLPIAGVISGSDTVCAGASITLADLAPGGVWTMANAAATIAAGVVHGSASGTDTVYYTVTNFCGVGETSAVVFVDALPTAGTISGSDTVCLGATITLTETVDSGSWALGTGSAAIAGGVVTGISVGWANIIYTTANRCGTDTAQFAVYTKPNARVSAIGGADSICIGSSLTLSDSATGGVWTASGSGTISDSGVLTPSATGTILVEYSLNNGCTTATATVSVPVVGLPVAGIITGGATVCRGASITLSDTAAGGIWTSVNGNAGIAAGVVTGLVAGTDTIKYTFAGKCGTVFASHVVTVDTLPVPTTSGSSLVCIGSTDALNGNPVGGLWTASNGSATVSPAGVVAGVTPGIDTITYEFTNICGAAGSPVVVRVYTKGECDSLNGVAATPVPQMDVKIFPNPNDGFFTVQLPENVVISGATIQITDLSGKEMVLRTVHTDSQYRFDFDLSYLPAATYFVRVTLQDRVWVSKLVVF